jgi:hypothetical protein
MPQRDVLSADGTSAHRADQDEALEAAPRCSSRPAKQNKQKYAHIASKAASADLEPFKPCDFPDQRLPSLPHVDEYREAPLQGGSGRLDSFSAHKRNSAWKTSVNSRFGSFAYHVQLSHPPRHQPPTPALRSRSSSERSLSDGQSPTREDGEPRLTVLGANHPTGAGVQRMIPRGRP